MAAAAAAQAQAVWPGFASAPAHATPAQAMAPGSAVSGSPALSLLSTLPRADAAQISWATAQTTPQTVNWIEAVRAHLELTGTAGGPDGQSQRIGATTVHPTDALLLEVAHGAALGGPAPPPPQPISAAGIASSRLKPLGTGVASGSRSSAHLRSTFSFPAPAPPSQWTVQRSLSAPNARQRLSEAGGPERLVGFGASYQPYVDQIVSEDLNSVTTALLQAIKLLQTCDPPATLQARGKRYFCSLKEVTKVLPRARAVIVAPDVKPSATAAVRPVRLLNALLASAERLQVPIVYALSRRLIGQVFGNDKSISVVAIMRDEHCEAALQSSLAMAELGRRQFRLFRALQET